MLAACALEAGELTVDDVDVVTAAVKANPGSSISPTREPTNWGGAYREVVYSFPGGCTGTIVGPYAVLTANHCGNTNGSIQSGGSTIAASSIWLSPYLDRNYTPDWYLTLDPEQTGWPAMHDQAILFLPTLTPAFLAARNIIPAAIDPRLPANAYTLVGVGSTPGGASRDSMAAGFIAANANQITSAPRDGYISRDSTTANFASPDGGDSGGPTFGIQTATWNGSPFEVRRAVFGTAQNACTGQCITDLAPLGYNIGVPTTTNQRETIRLNALWVKARADDADGDGLPSACDSAPTNLANSTNLCPAPLGSPSGVLAITAPTGLIECPYGYYATGLVGRAGDLIDNLSLRCKQVGCFGGGCSDVTDSETFGGAGGGAFETMCPADQVMIGVGSVTDDSAVHAIAPRCVPFGQIHSSSRGITQGTAHGNTAIGSAASRDCPVGRYLTGFQARTFDKRWTTGLQPICSPTNSFYTEHRGGRGGANAALSCPPGQVGVGVITRMGGGEVNMLGVWCQDRAAIRAGTAPSQANLLLLRPHHRDTVQNIDIPAGIDRGSNVVHVSGGASKFCPTGFALQGITVASDGSGTRPLSGVVSMRCKSQRSSFASAQTIAVNTGNATNPAFIGNTGSLVVDGLVARSGWMIDGAALHLTP